MVLEWFKKKDSVKDETLNNHKKNIPTATTSLSSTRNNTINNKSLHANKNNLLLPSNKIVKQFYIRLDEPHRIWKPNETLIGETVLELKKDMVNIEIELSLIGEIKVKSRNPSTTSLRSNKPFRFIEKSTLLYGDNIENIISKKKNNNFENSDTLIVNGLSKGIHKFPFRLKLPNKKKLFSSTRFEKGSIYYLLKGIIENINPLSSNKLTSIPSLTSENNSPSSLSSPTTSLSNNTNNYDIDNNNINNHNHTQSVSKCETKFQVIVPLDVSKFQKIRSKTVVLQSNSMIRRLHRLNSINDANSSTFTTTSSQVSKSSHSSSGTNDSNHSKTSSSNNNCNNSNSNNNLSSPINKTVSITVTIPRTGFVIGELIPVKINLQHYKEYYHMAGIITTLVRICRVADGDTENPLETFRKDICQNVSPLYVESNNFSYEHTICLKIPLDAFATFTSMNKMFSFQYYVEVMVNLSRKNEVYTESNKLVGGGTNDDIENSKKKILMSKKYNNNLKNNKTSYSNNNNNNNHKFLDATRKIESTLQNTVLNLMEPLQDDEEGSSIINNSNSSPNNNNNNNNTDLQDIEGQLSFSDMINVESLKRLRNVTGMSIEIIIGNTRNEKCKNTNKKTSTTISEARGSPTSTMTNYDNSTLPIIQLPSQSQSEELNDWLTSFEPSSSRNVDNMTNQSIHYNHTVPNTGEETVPEYSPPQESEEHKKQTESNHPTDDKQELERIRLQEMESEPPDSY